MNPDPHILFDGAHMRVTVFNPGQRKLFTSFRQRVPDPTRWIDPEPVRSFTDRNYTHLHIQSRANDWYINEDTSAMDQVLTAFAKPFRKSIAMGFSMGGYGTMRFAKALRLTDAMVVSGSSIPPFHAPFDRRYQPDAPVWKHELSLLETHGLRDLNALYLYDPFRRRDWLHARRLDTLQPQMQQARLYGGGHPATQVINGARNFSQLQKWLRQGGMTRPNVTALHRTSRAVAPVYWRHIAEVADRHGRAEFAGFAAGEHDRLRADAASKG